jgi:2-desacetyl-2-hydroxyethyl bacteriochlorophyllide A dehydrogenase
VKAVAVDEPDSLAVVDVPPPDGENDDATIVEVATTGLCGTDLKILHGAIPVAYPRVLGHEVIGRVTRPGPSGRVPQGARVLVDPSIACGRCRQCLADAAHLCPTGALMGRDVDGGLAELIATDERNLHPIPDQVSETAASLLQVLGTCVHAQTRVDVFPGQTAVVVGLGVTGLLHLQLLRARGIERVVGVTRSETKRGMARQLGAWAVAHPDDAADAVREVSAGEGADLVVESAGVAPALAQAIELAGFGAHLLLFGSLTESEVELPLYQLYYKELTMTNARAARARDYGKAVELAAAGALSLEPLWSASYPLDRASDAFAAVTAPEALKITLEVS